MTRLFVETRRPPVEIRDKVDISFRLKNQSISIFEMIFEDFKTKKGIEVPIAKATFVKSQQCWKLYWVRADLKWYAYSPMPKVKTLEAFLALVDTDEHSIFWV
ncbi:MAG: DUF3024 domain-containing protein [Mariprofundaceae bacterium]|nr:DUF3024 domain-containing protein [Mariprofundaceae bacterium]